MTSKRLFLKLLFLVLLLAALPALALAQAEAPAAQIPAAPDDNTPSTAIPISCGAAVPGAINPAGDVDYYKFEAVLAEPLVAYVVASEVGSPLDPVLSIQKYFEGFPDPLIELVGDDYDGLDPRLHYQVGFDGTTHLKVVDFGTPHGGASYTYTLYLDRPIYVSAPTNGTVAGISYAKGDILAYYRCSDRWEMLLDISDVGGLAANVNGLALLPEAIFEGDNLVDLGANFLMTFGANTNITGLGTVAPQDVVELQATDIGTDTAGSFRMAFDGSDVGLMAAGEAIDALALSTDGRLMISVKGAAVVPGVSGKVKDEDIIAFSGSAYGSNTSGTWAMYFDGSDVGLAGADIWGIWENNSYHAGDMTHFTFDAPESIGGLSYQHGDVFQCDPGSHGTNTTCGPWSETLNGAAEGITKIDALDMGSGLTLDNYPYTSLAQTAVDSKPAQ